MNFWDDIQKNADSIRAEYELLWKKAEAGPLDRAQAIRTLDVMWQRSHLDIATQMSDLKPYYPTTQGDHGERLAPVQHLWWVDHATAGISRAGTLGWFSSAPRAQSRTFDTADAAKLFAGKRGREVRIVSANGKFTVEWKGLSGAATHFVVGFDGVPFYVVNIANRCWGEPLRNKDGIHVEMVNALGCHLKNNQWHYWAGPIHPDVVKTNAPVSLDVPYRGLRNMMPYTWRQVITNIKLKRICIAATGRMDRQRMSDHADWRKDKTDMGPLWPREAVNNAAFEPFPVMEYSFVQGAVTAQGADDVVDPAELAAIDAGVYDNYNFASGQCAQDDEDIDSVVEVQKALMSLYGSAALPKFGADGDLGRETQTVVTVFQQDWNRNFPTDRLPTNGIPTVETMDRLEKALKLDERNFNKTHV